MTVNPDYSKIAIAVAQEKERELNYRTKPTRKDNPKIGPTLLAALQTAAESYLLIPDEQAKLRELLEGENDPVIRKAREYQIWLVAAQLQRASDVAQKRLDHFRTITTPAQVQAEIELCKSSKAHWFEYYAWGFDPRPDAPLNTIPLVLFGFQERFVEWLDHLVFRTRQSGVVPKSRDMGATEVALRWSVYNWLFRESFEVLLLSRTEDEVDSKKDVNTLFEKVRFQLRLLPEWMLPEAFNLDKDMPYMMIQNPETKSTFHGRAPTENVGRQLRVACVIYDEFAFAPNGGYKQHTSLSSTTKSLIGLSSVAGRLNKFADMVTDNKTPQFVMDWREHPWKTENWYNALPSGIFGVAMTAQQIAQEIDRDLDASQPGKVWRHREEYLFMTWAEVVGAFDKFGFRDQFIVKDANGHQAKDENDQPVYRVPEQWRWARYHDKGATEGHEFAYMNAARPTEFYPYHDTIFVFIGLELKPTGLTTEQAVTQWQGYEKAVGFRDKDGKFYKEPWSSKNSHEQKNLRKVLNDEYGEYWEPWDTDYIAGIEQVQVWFNIIDAGKPNPFRPELDGRCRTIFVAPNNEYKLAFNQQNGTYYLTNSKTERGYMTLRKQIPAYHYPEEERGKDVKKMRPAKQFDDIVDCLRALAVDEVKAENKTKDEEVESRTPEHLKQAEVAQFYGEEGFAELMMARQQEQRQIKMRIEEEEKEQHRHVNQVMGGNRRAKLLGGRKR